MTTAFRPIATCACCGRGDFVDGPEGLQCKACGSDLRSMALAAALVTAHQGTGTLAEFMSGRGAHLRILEVNESGALTQFLARGSGYLLVRSPEFDLQSLPFPDGSFDVVVHRGMLERVARPVRALAECKRVLVAGGFCVFTEYGADAWRQIIEAGFADCRIVPCDSAGAIALVGRRGAEDLPAPAHPGGPVAEEEVLKKKWFYRFELPSGARTESYLHAEVVPIHETRERMMFSVLDPLFAGRWSTIECIDVACHEGYFGSLLARRGCKRVLGIDARAENLSNAGMIRAALGIPNLEFRQGDVTSMNPSSLGKFDIVLMLGLLYHLENPLGALRLLRTLCREVALVETQLAPPLQAQIEWGTALARKQVLATFAVIDESEEVRSGNREANTVPVSLVPDLDGLLWLLKTVGFSRAEVVRPPEDAYEQLLRGQRAMVAAWV